ncbi:MAG: hypothetical protein ACPGU9_06735 [Flavobacteriaceae bacterium]
MVVSIPITYGIIRLALLWLFVYYVYSKSSKHNAKLDIIDFIVSRWFKYGSATVLIIFVLVLINGYDFFNTVFILFVYALFVSYKFKSIKKIYKQITKTIKKRVLLFLKHIELKKPIMYWFAIEQTKSRRINTLKSILALGVICVTICLYRIYLLKYDSYILSELWIEDLNKIISYNFHKPFQNLAVVEGEYLLINFYSKLVNISPEIALESFGVLQVLGLAILTLWVFRQFDIQSHVFAIISALILGVILCISPINIHLITQHQSVYLALTFAIPLFVYINTPKLIAKSNYLYCLYLLIAFLAIGLINIFVLLIIIPPFILIHLFQPTLNKFKYKGQILILFMCAVGAILVIYNGIDPTFDLTHFLMINLIAISSFTYTPHLIMPYGVFMNYVAFASLASLILLLKLYFINKKRNTLLSLFLVYYLLLVVVSNLNLMLIDNDLFYKAMSVMTPLIIGVNLVVLVKLLKQIISKHHVAIHYTISGLTLLLIFGIYTISHQKIDNTIKQTSAYSKNMIEIYNQINTSYMPYTYAVVNTANTQVFSTQNHFFMSYKDFNTTYLKRDSIYQKYKTNKRVLKQHPEYILPETVLFFKHKTKSITPTPSEVRLQHLIARGRIISKVYESEHVEVLEIINKPKSSKVVDLIYKNR